MVKVAVTSGARSVVSGCIIPAIAEKHDVVALSRKPLDRFSHLPNVQHVAVDFYDPVALDAALQGVHTVICTIFDLDEDAFIATSLALLQSALRVGAKRFAPSEFGPHGLHDDTIEVYRRKAVVADAVRKSGIEYTLFDTGFFMDALAVGAPGATPSPYKPIYDVENLTATIPGDGSAYMTYIRGEDLGKLVAASLELEKWPEVSRMIGDRKTFNEILRLAEKVRGGKFSVSYVSLETMKKRLDELRDPSDIAALVQTQFCIEMVASDRLGSPDANLNDLCPQVKPMGIEEFLQKWWGNV